MSSSQDHATGAPATIWADRAEPRRKRLVDDAGSEAVPPLTTITSLVAKRGHEQLVVREFERTFVEDAEDNRHLSALLIQQGDGLSFLVSQFSSRDELNAWRTSTGRKRLIEAFDLHSLHELCTIDHRVARLEVPNGASGAKWKGLVAGYAIGLPILTFVVLALNLVAPGLPLPLSLAIIMLVMSVTNTWIVGPLLARWTRTWRLKDQQMRIAVYERQSESSDGKDGPVAHAT